MNHCCQGDSDSLLTGPIRCPGQEPGWPYGGRGHRDPVDGYPALQVEDLFVSYELTQQPAVAGISLDVQSGQRIALIGYNGAGKSTLLKAAAGLVRPQSGTVRVYGNAVGACHHRTAYLPQRSDIDWQFPITVADLVMTGRYVHLGWFRRPGRQDRQHVAVALQRLGIADLAQRQISRLSGGQQQRVLIARALVQGASLFLLDEPLNAVDEATRDIVDQVLSDHASRGGSVLVATHDLGRLSESFDVAIYLQGGRIDSVQALPGGRCAGQKFPSGQRQPRSVQD
ncbi:MAG: ABC transporter ATP-binding protein [Pirellulaceae bacterium]|nr:ABC transporter ATP-binding protein [Pirellulaceae bacterium]